MKEIVIKAIYTLFGLNAASGLVYTSDTIYAISDQSNALYEYSIAKDSMSYHSLDGKSVNHHIKKSKKYDWEAILQDGDVLIIAGSGSKPQRAQSFVYHLGEQTSESLDMSYLYEIMTDFSEISSEDFNIEGLVKYKEDYIFINRGNGPKNFNALMFVQGRNFVDDFNTFTIPIKLPQINGVNTGFSDGIVVNDHLLFLATAENKASTYEDGAIGGTLIGAIDLKKMKLKFTEVISTTQKFEGIALHSIDGKNIRLLLCEDPDNNESSLSTIYMLEARLKKKI